MSVLSHKFRSPKRSLHKLSVGFILLLIASVILTACSSGPILQPTPANSQNAAHALTAQDLFAAVLTPSDISTVYTAEWWQAPPEFYVGIGAKNDPAGVNRQAWIRQEYTRTNLRPGQLERVVLALYLYDSPASAAGAFAGVRQSQDKQGTPVDGPAVGEESRYWQYSGTGNPAETAIRFRVGSVMARLSVLHASSLEKTATVAQLAGLLAQKTQSLLGGSLTAAPLPADLVKLMPSPSSTDEVGTVVGSAVEPMEAWALVASPSQPEMVATELKRMGAKQLAIRNYSLKIDRNLMVLVTLIPLSTENAATDWVSGFKQAAESNGHLNAGQTGPLSALTQYGQVGAYELEFAKGRYVVSAYCSQAFQDAGAKVEACEQATRRMAELWYAAMP